MTSDTPGYRESPGLKEDNAQFLRAASHDLGAPVRAIRNLSRLLRVELNGYEDTEIITIIEQIYNQSVRATDLLSDISALAKLDSHSPAPTIFSISKLTNEIIKSTNHPDTLNIAFVGPTFNVKASKPALDTVLEELIENSVRHHERKVGNVLIHALQSATQIKMEIIDDGPGIHPRHHKDVFEPFKRLQRFDDVPGTGLGLSIATSAAKLLNGYLQLTSPLKENRGTKFQLIWPRKF